MGSEGAYAIESGGLTKRYNGEVLVVDGRNLRIASGITYALLGPNGAGRTTTISMLTTLLELSSGRATMSGFDVQRQAGKVRQQIGVTFQDTVPDPDLTGRQMLDVHGRLYRQSGSERGHKIEELASLV